nr:MAG TPA: hypothetical protein [Caudoviricetes sp.]DAZ76231.1 MAG TPA: hypothetical protein [Caudoviricetes sp.]
MKHIKECSTCDRCGAEIGKMPDFLNYLIPVKMPAHFRMDYFEKTGYIANERLLRNKMLSATIVVIHERKSKEYELCPKCRKEFERWMKNEHGSSN